MRVPGGMEGHYAHWVEACMAGYGKVELSSPFEIAGPLTEAILMGNLAIRSHDIRVAKDRLASPGPWYTTAEVLAHLQSLENK